TGRKYQSYILHGYSKGMNFISVSKKTKEDLSEFVSQKIGMSEVVYNGLNPAFRPQEPASIRKELSDTVGADMTPGFLLHVGGNQWYKNRRGVIEMYNAWRKISEIQLPLLLVGSKANTSLLESYNASPYR